MTGIHRRGRVVLDRQLDALGGFGAGNLFYNFKREVDAGGDPTACIDISVAHASSLARDRADQGQQMMIGPVRGRFLALKQARRSQYEGAGTDRGYIGCRRTGLSHERHRLLITDGVDHAKSAGHEDHVERGCLRE